MDELDKKLHSAKILKHKNERLHWIPIRHHSPACSFHLLDFLKNINPDKLLIEGSIDFNSQVESLTHPETIAPVALYGEGRFFPFSETSPEWAALRWASENNIPISFIDLPISDDAWNSVNTEQPNLAAVHESKLQHSSFVKSLIKKTGSRNVDELWDKWFELLEFSSAEIFFDRVFDYCTSSRLTYSKESMQSTEDAAREVFMAECIQSHLNQEDTICVITGGFHTLALIELINNESQVPDKSRKENIVLSPTWLIRFSQDRLDSKSGYGAGMRAPDFYEKLLKYRINLMNEKSVDDFILEIINQLDNDKSPLSISVSTKLQIVQQVRGLCNLRGHAWPGAFDIIDAVKSVVLKREILPNDSLVNKIWKALAGNKIGGVSIDQPPLPLVNELYEKLTKARFKLNSSLKVTTKIALYGRQCQKRASLLYQCQFLDLGFATKLSGPYWIRGHNLELRNEHWQYAWTPLVEVKLADLANLGGTWDGLLKVKINQSLVNLGHDALLDCQRLFIQLVLMGSLDLASQVWNRLTLLISKSTDNEQLAQLLLMLIRLRNAKSDLLAFHSVELDNLVNNAWRQLMFCLPQINLLDLADGLTVLLLVQEITQECSSHFNDPWRELWSNRLLWMSRHAELSIGLNFACRAILANMGILTADSVANDLKKLLNRDIEGSYLALYAIIKVSPSWLTQTQKTNLLSMLNEQVASWSDERFMDALPDLRLLFSQFDPKTIESLAICISEINSWNSSLDTFEYAYCEEQVLQAHSLQQELVYHLQEKGLQHWIDS